MIFLLLYVLIVSARWLCVYDHRAVGIINIVDTIQPYARSRKSHWWIHTPESCVPIPIWYTILYIVDVWWMKPNQMRSMGSIDWFDGVRLVVALFIGIFGCYGCISNDFQCQEWWADMISHSALRRNDVLTLSLSQNKRNWITAEMLADNSIHTRRPDAQPKTISVYFQRY